MPWLSSSLDPVSLSESILPGYPKFQCFILYIVLFHPCFWFVFFQSALSCVLLCCVRVLLVKIFYFLFVFKHTNTHTFTLHLKKKKWEKLSLSVCSHFQRSPKAFDCLGRWQFEPSGHEGGTKHQQSFQFGSEEQTLTNQCWSKLNDVTTFTTELLNLNPLHGTF